MQGLEMWSRDALIAEVERLQAELTESNQEIERQGFELSRYMTEVEGLRRDRDSWKEHARAVEGNLRILGEHDIKPLKAEVERLREWSKDKPEAERRWRETVAENERLRGECETASLNRLENERLRRECPHDSCDGVMASVGLWWCRECDRLVLLLPTEAGLWETRLATYADVDRLVIEGHARLVGKVESLRTNLATTVENRDAWMAKVERLRRIEKAAKAVFGEGERYPSYLDAIDALRNALAEDRTDNPEPFNQGEG